MNETEQALTERVGRICREAYITGYHQQKYKASHSLRDAEQIIAAVRAHDEQAALNCGHCTPNADEIACGCQIEERNDER